MTRSRALPWFCLLAVLPLSAQTTEAPPKPAAAARQVRFLPVGDLPPFRQEVRDGIRYELEPPAGSIPPREVLLGFGEEAQQAAPLSLGRVSEALKAPAGIGPLLVRRKNDAAEAEPWLRLERPESGDFLVLLWRDPATGSWEKARSLVLPDSREAAPAGQVRVVNLSPVTVGVVFAGEKIALQSGKTYKRAVAVGKETDIQLGAVDAKGALTRFHSGTVFQNPGERTLVVIYRADGVQPRRPLKAVIQREPLPPLPPKPKPGSPAAAAAEP
jgi:hypothetical protein